jgi:NF-X1-type zinc finger protein NFXL1
MLTLRYLILSIKVNVCCACNTLKQEWICQDVVKEYRNSGRDPKEVPKSQFGAGLLACGEDCKKKLKVQDSELHLRKTQENKVTPLNTEPFTS